MLEKIFLDMKTINRMFTNDQTFNKASTNAYQVLAIISSRAALLSLQESTNDCTCVMCSREESSKWRYSTVKDPVWWRIKRIARIILTKGLEQGDE